MDDSNRMSLEQIRAFLAGAGPVEFAGQGRAEVYGWVERTLVRHEYAELKHDLSVDHFCLKPVHATEAAFRAVLLLFNLLAEFQRAAGWTGYREPATIRTQVLTCGAILGRSARRLVLHMGQSWGGPEDEETPPGQHLGLANPNFAEVGFALALLTGSSPTSGSTGQSQLSSAEVNFGIQAYPTPVRPHGKLAFTSWWENKGVAPCYRQFPLALRLSNERQSAVMTTAADIRTWLPGDIIYDDAVFLPADLPAGQYELSIAILDTVAREPKVKLAIAGVQPDGWIPLGKVEVRE